MSLTHLLAALPEPLFSDYTIERIVGVGAFAIVFQIRSTETDEAFALKVVEKEPMKKRGMMPQLDREVALLDAMSFAPNVIELLEVLHTTTHVFMRFELCDESMEDALEESGPMTEEEAFGWFRQMCLGVQALHKNGVIHRDLKPSNMLIDGRGVLRICDFGWACHENDRLSGSCGTPQYSPPECQQNSFLHTTKADIYGLGGCLQHMLLGDVPKSPNDLPKGLSEETIDLLQELMDPTPSNRPSIEEVLDRPQLAGENALAEQFSNIWHSLAGFIYAPTPKKSGKKKTRQEEHCGFRPFS